MTLEMKLVEVAGAGRGMRRRHHGHRISREIGLNENRIHNRNLKIVKICENRLD